MKRTLTIWLAFFALPVSSQQASFEGLGDLPGGGFTSYVLGVSANGRLVVGYSGGGDGLEAFLWEEGVMRGLGDLPGGDFLSVAWAVSNNGEIVVGYGINRDSDFEAFRWEEGLMEGLGHLPGGQSNSWAFDVSADGGVVVGFADVAGGGVSLGAFRWEDGKMIELPELQGGAVASYAYSVSSDGEIVIGASWGSDVPVAVRWVNGVLEVLGAPPGSPWAIGYDASADASVVVGRASANLPSGEAAFIWREELGFEYLPDLPRGSFNYQALTVSGDGSVVGGVAEGPNGFEAVLWIDARSAISLKEMLEALGVDLTGWKLEAVARHGLSYDGTVVVGNGVNPEGLYEAWRAELPPWSVANSPEVPVNARPSLHPNYPNPFYHQTTFRFSIPEAGHVSLKIYDVLGREVMTLFDHDHEAGIVTLRWNPSNQMGQSLSSGVYLYRLKVGNHVETRTLTVLR